MKQQIENYSGAIAALRLATPGTPLYGAAFANTKRTASEIARATNGMSSQAVVATINKATVDFNALPNVAETVVPSNAYPPAFIDFLAERLKPVKRVLE